MTVFLLNGFRKFFKNQMRCGSGYLKPNIWMGLIFSLPEPREAPSFGKVYTKSNISLNGGLLLRLVIVTIVFFGKTVGYMLFHLRFTTRSFIKW
jgi:hypothetical protein